MSLNRLVLVINASYEPINFVPARRAMKMICKGKAMQEQASSYHLRTARLEITVPAVIRLTHYRRVPRLARSVSRKGIILRDRNTCQYCHQKMLSGELTMDHVVPRSRGGASTWENMVACCFRCNNIKADRTPAEAGMELLRQPRMIGAHAKYRLMVGDDDRSLDKYFFN